MQLEGQVALVTGGGRGIGRGIVDRFLAEGALVAVAQRRPLDESLASNPDVLHVAADLTDTGSIAAIVEQAAAHFNGLDILVNNAGVMFEASVEDITPEQWDTMIAINLRAPLFLTQAALPHLRARGGGSIVNIGSIEGIGANPQHTAYSASKGGVHGLTRALAVDLGPTTSGATPSPQAGSQPSSARPTWTACRTRRRHGTHSTGCTRSAGWAAPPTSATLRYSSPATAHGS